MNKIPTISYNKHYNLLRRKQSCELKLIAQAKINLNLNILGKRSDGYHELHTIMQSLALHDIIDLTIKNNADSKESVIKVLSNNHLLNIGEDNLAYHSAKLFLEKFTLKANLEILINKRIPLASGLAGGSANAAAVLRGLAVLFNNPETRDLFSGKGPQSISEPDLLKIAQEIGADVPFCLLRGTALCEGIGEKITPLNSFAGKPVLIYNPRLTVFTKEAFKALNAPSLSKGIIEKQLTASDYKQILDTGLEEMNINFNNDFSTGLLKKYPDLRKICQAFRETGGAFVRITGSGPTIYAIYDSYTCRDHSFRQLKKYNFPGTFIPTYTKDAWD